MRIALDAMGGDFAPRSAVAGAVEATRTLPGLEVFLVGDQDRIQAELRLPANQDIPDRLHVIHAADVIGMAEAPLAALKGKADSSIMRAVELVRTGRADAVVSAGNTGAMVGACALRLRMLKGVKRAGIAANLPTTKGHCTIIDVGANVHCKPLNLYQYGVMASIYRSAVMDCPKPTVGLLNVGVEETKGNLLVRSAMDMLGKSNLNYVGNVEGNDIFHDRCDVVVCDGFVGNVILKSSEGLSEALAELLTKGIARDHWTRLGFGLMRPVFDDIQPKLDFSEYGGAPLLGVRGTAIICHGRSDPRAIANAIGAAGACVRAKVNENIVLALSATKTR